MPWMIHTAIFSPTHVSTKADLFWSQGCHAMPPQRIRHAQVLLFVYRFEVHQCIVVSAETFAYFWKVSLLPACAFVVRWTRETSGSWLAGSVHQAGSTAPGGARYFISSLFVAWQAILRLLSHWKKNNTTIAKGICLLVSEVLSWRVLVPGMPCILSRCHFRTGTSRTCPPPRYQTRQLVACLNSWEMIGCLASYSARRPLRAL